MFQNLKFAKINPREMFKILHFAKINPREISKMQFAKINPRENLSSRKLILAKIYPFKVYNQIKLQPGHQNNLNRLEQQTWTDWNSLEVYVYFGTKI